MESSSSGGNTEIGRVLSCEPIPDIRGWMVGQQSIKQLTQRDRRPLALTPAIVALSLEVIVSGSGSARPVPPHTGTYWSCCWVLHPRPLLTISQYLIRTLKTVPGDTACMDAPSWGRWTSCAACRSREKQQQKAKLEKNHSEGLTWGQWSVDTTR